MEILRDAQPGCNPEQSGSIPRDPNNPLPNDKPPSVREVISWHTALFGDSDDAIEIRAPKLRSTNLVWRFAPGRVEAAVRKALAVSGQAPAVYVVMNGVSPSLPLGERKGKGAGASAADIPRRRLLLIDVDPRRKDVINATDAEKAAAYEVAMAIRAMLVAMGWPEPIVADSGNGYHLLFRVDLPADDVFGIDANGNPTHDYGPSTLLVRRVLEALAARFGTPAVEIDCRVFDLPRLVKFYGTRVCKGEDTPERPARYSRFLSVPSEFAPVPVELLEELAAAKPKASTTQTTGKRTSRRTEWTPEARAIAYLARCDPAIQGQDGSGRCFKAACNIGPGFDLAPDVAYRLLWEHYNPRCVPPWSERELRHKVEDAYKVETARGWLRNAERTGSGHAGGNGRHTATGDDRGEGPGDGQGAEAERDRLTLTPGVFEASDDPHRLARTYVEECHSHPDHPTLVRYLDDFHEHRDGCYQVMPDSTAEADLTAAIKREFDRLCLKEKASYAKAKEEFDRKKEEDPKTKEKEPPFPVARKVTGKTYSDTLRALRSMVAVPHTRTMPCWLRTIEGAPDPRNILPTRDGLLDLSSLVIEEDGTVDLHRIRVYDPTPAFFSPYVLTYHFDPDAPEPRRWRQFLDEIFPNDPVARRELQKWFGYLVTMDTSRQKMLYLIGRPRSGKGTIGNVLTELVGTANVTSPALMELAEPFGLSDCLGKTILLISDARIAGYDQDLARLQERLLKISGEDRVQVNRKYRSPFTTKLLNRIVIISNEVPGFRDPSGAFKSRMRPLRFLQSFEGKEDKDLFEGKLKPEMPGILNWAIVGKAMLQHDGGFNVPESAEGLVKILAESATPINLFLADCCTTTDPKATVKKEDIYLVYRWWCHRNGNTPKASHIFGRQLMAACSAVDDTRLRERDPLTGDELRPPGYKAIHLQPDVLEKAQEWQRQREGPRRF